MMHIHQGARRREKRDDSHDDERYEQPPERAVDIFKIDVGHDEIQNLKFKIIGHEPQP